MRSSRGRAGGVRRFERDEDGTGAGYEQRTRSSREPVSRLAAGGGRAGLGAGRAPAGSASGARAAPLSGAVRAGWGKGGAVTRRARARLGEARGPGWGARALRSAGGRGLGPEVGAAARRRGGLWAAAEGWNPDGGGRRFRGGCAG